MNKPCPIAETPAHGDEYQGELEANFSSNVWYGMDHAALIAHINNGINRIKRYPEPTNAILRKQLALKTGVDAEQLLLCNGSIEGIFLIAQAYQNKKSLIVSPTFSEYAHACRVHNHQITECRVGEVESKLGEYNPDLVWICTPNNPDGSVFDFSFLEVLIANHPATQFVFDVSFREYCQEEQPDAGWANKFANVFIIYSFTKRYGIPGLRIGFVASCEDHICKLQQQAMPWSVNTVAGMALECILNDYQDDFNIGEWLAQKDAFTRKINERPYTQCIESATPFFLVKLTKGTAAGLKAFMLARKILIRDANTFFATDEQYIRLLTLSTKQNTKFIKVLTEWETTLAH